MDLKNFKLGESSLQKILGVWFMASVIVLSYVATIHIVTARGVLNHPARETAVRQQRESHTLLSGPVSFPALARRDSRHGVKLKYHPPVLKRSASSHPKVDKKKVVNTKAKKAKKLTKKHARPHRGTASVAK